MAYGNDVSVYVEDKAGDLGASPSPAPWWISPDVDIPAHTGEAAQGSNDVRIRVHAHEEPFVEVKIAAEVYVGKPGFVLSPTTGTKRIDPGNLLFRPANVPGTEPIADEPGGTLTFPWTPSSVAADIDGPGHRCLILRAFPVDVTPPTTPFDVPNEQHEAQHNLEILTTTKKQMDMSDGGAGTPKNPRGRDRNTGLWWEEFTTMAVGKEGKRFVVWAFDPEPSTEIVAIFRKSLKKGTFKGFSGRPPGKVTFEALGTSGREVDPGTLLGDGKFVGKSGLGKGLFSERRIVGAASLDLSLKRLSGLLMRFDLSDLDEHTAVVLHGAQYSAAGRPEGGMTVVALAPV